MNMNKMHYLSIQVINSKYKVFFTIIIYCIIYSFFYLDKTIAFCMNNNSASANDVPIPSQKERDIMATSSPFYNDFLSFLGYSERLQEQRETINMLNEENEQLRREFLQSRLETRRIEKLLGEVREEQTDLNADLYDLQHSIEAAKVLDSDAEIKFLKERHRAELNCINQTLEYERKSLLGYQKKCERLEMEATLKEERDAITPSLISNLQNTLDVFVKKEQDLKLREDELNMGKNWLAKERENFNREQEEAWERTQRRNRFFRERELARTSNQLNFHDESIQTDPEKSENLMARYIESLPPKK